MTGTDLIERLERRFVALCSPGEGGPDPAPVNPDGPEAAALIRTLQADKRRMEEALEPFVEYAGYIDDGETFRGDSEIVSVLSGGIRRSITFNHLRRARAALNREPGT